MPPCHAFPGWLLSVSLTPQQAAIDPCLCQRLQKHSQDRMRAYPSTTPSLERWRFLTKCGPLEKEMANYFSLLSLRTLWTVWKDKTIWDWKMNFLGQQMSNMLLGKSREIATEGMKRLNQRGNDTQLCVYLVVNVKSNAVKNHIAQDWNARSMNQCKLEVVNQAHCQPPQEWTWHIRNQWTKMDGNMQI